MREKRSSGSRCWGHVSAVKCSAGLPPPLYSVWDPSPWGDAAHPHTGWVFSPHLLLSGNTCTAQRRVLDDPKPSQAD